MLFIYQTLFVSPLFFRYFEGGVSSVFLWDLDDGGFAGVVLLKKSEFHNKHDLSSIFMF